MYRYFSGTKTFSSKDFRALQTNVNNLNDGERGEFVYIEDDCIDLEMQEDMLVRVLNLYEIRILKI